ncbi:aminopeptidase [Anaerotalea alkaliphila]|uniref:Aminopeptidase n=1 Tax=Anaerotalea alkaliphila TaxID=2662126 RepID=A0A7X5KN26_9FIRM|nr:aminopeptidase [Anaerotalea alkaliphila]NDL67338.1 aminopeptidase [Anaerotalea alkaliphila]
MDQNVFAAWNEVFEDRYKAVAGRLEEWRDGKGDSLGEALGTFVRDAAGLCLEMVELERELPSFDWEGKDLAQLLAWNRKLHRGFLEEEYPMSWANPAHCVEALGGDSRVAVLLANLYASLRTWRGYAFEHRTSMMALEGERLLEVFDALETGAAEGLHDSLVEVLRAQELSQMETVMEQNLVRRMDPAFRTYASILEEENLGDPRYLFRYGIFLGENELETARHLAALPEGMLEAMARTYVDAFFRGYARDEKDLTGKKTVNLSYQAGFEPVLRRAAALFRERGLLPLVHFDLEGSPRPRLIHTKSSRQLEYDHRFDDGILLTEGRTRVAADLYDRLLEKHHDLVTGMAGPAVMESFGEKPFVPAQNPWAVKYTPEQTEQKTVHTSRMNAVYNKHLPRSAWSFTIITYPLPEIGPDYEAVFQETIRVNTLDVDLYERIQKTMIDALDRASHVRVTGRNGNRTDLVVALPPLKDLERQTNFNNCTADVNVPVGEVFTSPQLKGTNGLLHVKEVYLFDLQYRDLEFTFQDGVTVDYACANYEDPEENRRYVQENLLHPHQSLPLGEFAIGTNTTAYAMARRYRIGKLLPILIEEKTGPHFAIGDTCYSWSEDLPVHNQDGKEVMAKDNERSICRKTDVAGAYTYKHTDITIPYDELGDIVGVTEQGEEIPLLRNGRFVLPGTEELNIPLDALEEAQGRNRD